MQRMPGKDPGHERARPARTRHAVEDEEKQDGVGRVNENARQMVAAGLRSPELDIQHVGKPGDRMPVADMKLFKSPHHTVWRKTTKDMRILRDVEVVVVVHEIVMTHGGVDRDRPEDERKTD